MRRSKTLLVTFLMIFGLAQAVYSAAIPADGLAAWWPFDEGSGTVAHDVGSHGNDGVVHGASWVTGSHKTALYFDGNCNDEDGCDYVEIPYRPEWSLALTSKFTIDCWVKLAAALPSGYGYVGLLGTPGPGIQLHFQSEIGALRVVLEHPGRQSEVFLSNRRSWEADVWHHIVIIFDSALPENNLQIYVDDEPDSEFSSQGALVTDQQPLYIGALWDLDLEGYFHGAIDEVRILNYPTRRLYLPLCLN